MPMFGHMRVFYILCGVSKPNARELEISNRIRFRSQQINLTNNCGRRCHTQFQTMCYPGFALSLTKMYRCRMKQPNVSLGAFIRPPGVDYHLNSTSPRSDWASNLLLLPKIPAFISGKWHWPPSSIQRMADEGVFRQHICISSSCC